jgi:predicted metal-binding protein
MTTLTVCRSCPAAQAGFETELRDAIVPLGLAATVTGVECMSGCANPTTLACRATGKTAYLFGDVTAADLPDILTFLTLYIQSPDGNFADARPLGALRHKALARIPG